MKKTNSNFSFILCLVVAGILLYWISLPVFGVVSPQERAALIALYNNTNGDDWSSTYGWKKPPLDLDGFAMPGTEKNWYGIKCDPDNTTVQRIDLYNNNLNGALPPELGNLANLTYLGLNNNQLSGNIPPELGNLANLHDLELFSNQLSGSIPPELGNLANLHNFDLGYNKLTGSIPSTFTNLTKLVNDWSDLTYNALYTNNDTLRVFLHSKQISGDWQGAQTVAPTNLSATPISSTSIDIHWTPIIYKGNSGGYRVFYSNIPGGPYTYFGITADKTASSLPVTELNPDTTYYFVVQTRTDPNYANRNTVDSEYSGEVSGVTCHLVTISGKVTAGGRGLQGVTITLSNNGGIKTTGYNGYYCASVPYGWSGTATPSKRGYCFFPVKRSYCNLKANQTSQNYTTSQQTRTISGTVTFGSSKLPGVTITLDNNGGSATTDANGNYSVTVNYGWSGTATPSYPGYDFTPANRSYTNVTTDQTNQDYKATLKTLTISGRVMSSGGSGLQGVPIILTNGGGSATTDANGYYSVTVNYGWTGTATPSKAGYNFTPANRSYTNVTTDQTNQDYTSSLQTRTISGTVTFGSSKLQGVTIILDSSGGSATTDANGNYSVTVNYGWSGTATPSYPGYDFTPANRSYTNVTTDQTNQDYTSSLQTRTISGTVTFGSSKLPGVTITLDNNGGSATTDANGNYSVTVNYGWSGTATPSYPGYDFTPANRSYTNVTADQTNQDYIVSVIIILTLTSPNGGETWPITSLRNITWKAAGISDNLEITLWKGGVLIGIIADDINPAVGFYAWTVGQLIDGSMVSCGSDYTIKIKETGQSPEDSSDANFNISPGITVDAPNGGETLKFGDLLQITWRTGCLSHNIKITLWTDSGWEGLIKYNINPADGSFLWTVGDVFDSTGKAKLPVDINLKYKIKIKEISTVVSDYSDNYITLIK